MIARIAYIFLSFTFLLSLASDGALAKHTEPSGDDMTAAGAEGEPFSDVPSYHRNFEAIETLRTHGLVRGYGGGMFRPGQLINRAEITAMIVRALDPNNPHPDEGRYKNCFNDVAKQWFAKYVCFGKANLWLKGYPGTQLFRPDQPVIVVEALRMAIDAFKIGVQAPIVPYKHKWDIPRGFKNEPEKFPGEHWWETYLVTARFWNFLDTTPEAGKMMSRAEIAEILFRIMKHKKLIE